MCFLLQPKILDPRGHRPVSRGEVYTPVVAAPPISGRGRYGVRPTAVPTGMPQEQKREPVDSGGCKHASEEIVRPLVFPTNENTRLLYM